MSITIQQINDELAMIVSALAEAADSRDKGISIDLTPLTLQATQLCDQIIKLPPQEAMQLLPDLQKAVDDLNNIHLSVKHA